MAEYYQISMIRPLVRTLVDDDLKTDGRDAWLYEGVATFTLSKDYPSSATIVVYQNGTDITSANWTYNSSTNIVTVSSSLTTNDTILISYSYYDKYSDTELLNYIKASFPYFSQFGYRKIFRLNSDSDEVIAEDNLNATTKEGYQIAIITAILIDPQNIDIRTKDFSITAKEKMSRIELISLAFSQFQNFVGTITFDEDLEQENV